MPQTFKTSRTQTRKQSKPFSPLQKTFIVLLAAGVFLGGAWALDSFGGTIANLTLGTQDALETGLLGHWTFDGKDMGPNVRDRSGQGNHGNLSHGGAGTTTAPGRIGQALAFSAVGGGSITFSRVQSAEGSDDNPASATFGATPTEGNLLVAIVAERSGNTHANYTISGTGWTKRVGRDTLLTNSTHRKTLIVWTKVAGASEPTNIQADNGESTGKRILIQEFSAGTEVTWTFEDEADNDSGTSFASPLSSGTTGSVADGDLFVVTVGMWRDDGFTVPGSIAWTNGIGDIVNALDTNQSGNSLSSGFLQTATGGTKESEVSWEGSAEGSSAAILVFSATGPASSQAVAIGAVNGSVKTLSFWMKADSATEEILELNGSTDIAVSGGTLAATGFTTPTIYVDGAVSSTITANTWHHVAITTATGINASAMNVGSVDGTGFSGLLDDVRIYDRALSTDEITHLYQLGATTKLNTTVDTQPALETDLVGHWTMDGKDIDLAQVDIEARDRSGNGNHGFWRQHASTTVPGRIGQAVWFDGVDDDIHVNDQSGQLDAIDVDGTEVTVSLWFNLDEIPAAIQASAGKYDTAGSPFTGERAFRLFVDTTSNCWTVQEDPNSFNDSHRICDPTPIQAGTWYHVVGTFKGDDHIRFYTNGVLVAEQTGDVPSRFADTSEPFMISGSANGTTQLFEGKIDDVRLYDRALTQDDISRLYHLGATTKVNTTINTQPALESGLVGHWTFDGKDIASTTATRTAIDRSGQGNTGTMSSNPLPAPGRFGQALSFDGTDDYIALGTGLDFGNGSPASVSAWIFPESFGGGTKGRIVQKFDPVDLTSFNLNNSDFSSGLEFFKSGSASLNARAPDSITLNEWQHVVMTWDGGANRSGVEFSVNGIQQAKSGGADGSAPSDDTGMAAYIADRSDGTRSFDGDIDDVRIYSRALSAAEVMQLYRLGAN